MNFLDDNPATVYEFTLKDGRELIGQINHSETWYSTSGEPSVLGVLEGAGTRVTYIPWHSVSTYHKRP